MADSRPRRGFDLKGPHDVRSFGRSSSLHRHRSEASVPPPIHSPIHPFIHSFIHSINLWAWRNFEVSPTQHRKNAECERASGRAGDECGKCSAASAPILRFLGTHIAAIISDSHRVKLTDSIEFELKQRAMRCGASFRLFVGSGEMDNSAAEYTVCLPPACHTNCVYEYSVQSTLTRCAEREFTHPPKNSSV